MLRNATAAQQGQRSPNDPGEGLGERYAIYVGDAIEYAKDERPHFFLPAVST